MTIKVVIRGEGDLGSGVALRLSFYGFRVHIPDTGNPDWEAILSNPDASQSLG